MSWTICQRNVRRADGRPFVADNAQILSESNSGFFTSILQGRSSSRPEAVNLWDTLISISTLYHSPEVIVFRLRMPCCFTYFAVKEAVVVVRRLNWADKVSPAFHMPQIQGHMILIMLEVWKKGCFQERSDKKWQSFILDIYQPKTPCCLDLERTCSSGFSNWSA